jgi:hypothetical protein
MIVYGSEKAFNQEEKLQSQVTQITQFEKGGPFPIPLLKFFSNFKIQLKHYIF